MLNSKYEKYIVLFCHLLKEKDIAYMLTPLRDGAQWTFPSYPSLAEGDVIICSGSGRGSDGYIESLGMPWDNDNVSVLTPEQMCDHIFEIVIDDSYDPEDHETYYPISTILKEA